MIARIFFKEKNNLKFDHSLASVIGDKKIWYIIMRETTSVRERNI